MLEDGEGRKFAKFVRKEQNSTGKIPIISMSGNAIEEQRKQYEDCDIDAFYQKPLNKTQLLNLLDYAIH